MKQLILTPYMNEPCGLVLCLRSLSSSIKQLDWRMFSANYVHLPALFYYLECIPSSILDRCAGSVLTQGTVSLSPLQLHGTEVQTMRFSHALRLFKRTQTKWSHTIPTGLMLEVS